MSAPDDCTVCRIRTVYAADGVTVIHQDRTCDGNPECVLKDAILQGAISGLSRRLPRTDATEMLSSLDSVCVQIGHLTELVRRNDLRLGEQAKEILALQAAVAERDDIIDGLCQQISALDQIIHELEGVDQ